MHAYQLLSVQREQLAHDLTVLASQHRSLQRDLADMQTDTLAHDAAVQEFERQIVLAQSKETMYPSREMLVTKISNLERDNEEIKRALLTASKLLFTSRMDTECD